MGLQERLDALQPRERQLLNVLLIAFVVIVLVLIPVATSAMLSSARDDNEQLRATIEQLLSDRDDIQERQQKNQAVLARYAQSAPALAAFLDSHAKQLELDIPEFKDRPPVPHGKDYEERATEIRVKKVNMRPLILFLERVAGSEMPISITKLNIRKRGSQLDVWDASFTISAYHRIAKAESPPSDDAEDSDEESDGDE